MEIFRGVTAKLGRKNEKVENPAVQEALEPTHPSPGEYLVKEIKTYCQKTPNGREIAGYEFEIIGHGNDGTAYCGTIIKSGFWYNPNFDTKVDQKNPRRDPILIIRNPGEISTLVAPDGRIIVDGDMYENNLQRQIMPYQSHGLTDGPSFTRVKE